MEKLKELVKNAEEAEAKCDANRQSFAEFCAALDVVSEKRDAVRKRIHELTGIDTKNKKINYQILLTVIEMMDGFAKRFMNENETIK